VGVGRHPDLGARTLVVVDPILPHEAELRAAMLADVSALDRLIDDALLFTTLDGSAPPAYSAHRSAWAAVRVRWGIGARATP
jgi:hypothetical protein